MTEKAKATILVFYSFAHKMFFMTEFKKIGNGIWEIEKEATMRVPARVIATEKLLKEIEQGAIDQLKNTATLPGIQKVAWGMPDMHWGYGFCIGGVAAFDAKEEGVVSPGGIGFDINCTHPDTKVLLKNGYWITIKALEKKFKEIGANIFDKQDNSLKNASIAMFLKREEKKGILEIKTKTGRLLKITGDHPVLAINGMKNAAELEKEQIMVYGFEGVAFEEPSNKILLTKKNVEKFLDEFGLTNKGNAKKQVLTFFDKIGILPLKYDSPQLPSILKIMGFVYGDGSISITKNGNWQVSFFGKAEDLETIRKDLQSLGFKAQQIFRRKRDHCINTFYGKREFHFEENSLLKKSKAFAALLVLLGVPFGAKTHKEYRIPKWVLDAPLWQKRLFLASFFGAELSAPKTLNKYNFFELQLNMNKSSTLKENAIDFLNDIRLMLFEFGVKSRAPVIVNGYTYEGKKGQTTGFRILIKANPRNLIRLFETVGFEYNKEKQKKGCLAASYLRLKEKISKERENARAKALERYNSGETVTSIRKDLVKEFVSEQFIRHSIWTKYKSKPRIAIDFISFEEYCKKSAVGNEGFIWEEIEEIKAVPYNGFVYDLTIANENHNFIADSFVVSNCGVRLVRTNLTAQELKPKLKELLDTLFSLVPAGVGGKGKISLNETQLKELLRHGARWAVENNYGWEKDLKHIEENGEMKEANPEKVSQKAIQRGKPQSGTLGSGNHFLEIQEVKEIFDEKIAKKFGLFEGQAVVMLHSGSRGLGHQIATDYIEVMLSAMKKYGISVPDKQLACAPIESVEGKDYLAAMNCGVNYAFANRQAMTHWAREGFAKVLGQSAESLGMNLVYDICHNVAKFEEHEINGKKKEVLVHRKGATRAMPAGRKENPVDYSSTGHPAIIPGSMGTSSFVLVGTEFGLQETFASVCHGAGRAMSRTSAMKMKRGEQVKAELEAKGEIIKGASFAGLAEEAPEAYKDIEEVIKSIELAGIGKKVARMVPLAVMKG